MGTLSQTVKRRAVETVVVPVIRGASRAMPASIAPVAIMPAAVRSETRIAVLSPDPLFAFAVTSIAAGHFSTATVLRPDIDDLRAARHLDSRTHALIIVDAAVMSHVGEDALGQWLRPFRSVPILLLSATPGAVSLDHCSSVTDVPRDVAPRGLAEAIRNALGCPDRVATERRPRPQEIERITATQWRVIGYLGAGHSNKEIAYRMGISEATVKAHVGAAIARLGLTNRTEVALFAQRMSLGARWAKIATEVEAPV